MKRNIIIGIVLVVLAIIAWRFWHTTRVPMTLSTGTTTIALEVADTPNERVRGLSGRAALPANTGMLFIFDRDDYHAFWMPDMHFALDIVWLDADYRVVHIERGVTPESYPTLFRPSQQARFVLELTAGQADALQITLGTTLTPSY